MKMDGYCGICGICFEPIKNEDGVTIGDNDKHYHRKCTEEKPNSYYYALERIEFEFNKGTTNAADLMNEMESIYNIPTLNDAAFNEEYPEVISLYRRIAGSRKL